MLKFEDEVKKCYNKPIKFTLQPEPGAGPGEGLRELHDPGVVVDYAVFAPSHAATFSKMTTIMDMPFLFRDIDHWNKVLSTVRRSSLSTKTDGEGRHSNDRYAGAASGTSWGRSR